MDNKRLFVALPVEEGISQQIFKKFGQLDLPWEKIKVVPNRQLHLTLKFIGDTPLEKLPLIIEALENIKIEIQDLEIKIYQSKIFNPNSPRTLVLAIADNPLLKQLQANIEKALFTANISHYDNKKFTPHLTLARVKKKATLEEFKEFASWKITKSFYTAYFQLMESELSKTGPSYTELQNFYL